jgi:hypothetical protein
MHDERGSLVHGRRVVRGESQDNRLVGLGLVPLDRLLDAPGESPEDDVSDEGGIRNVMRMNDKAGDGVGLLPRRSPRSVERTTSGHCKDTNRQREGITDPITGFIVHPHDIPYTALVTDVDRPWRAPR